MSEKIKFTTSCRLRLDEFLRLNLPEKINEIRRKERKENVAKENAFNFSDGTGASVDFAHDDSFAAISNSKIRRLILSGSVFVNGMECRRPAFEIRGKSVIQIEFDAEKFFFEKQPDDINFTVTDKDVLHEDENLIFINKPAFFPVEQTITGNRKNLHDAVVDYLWKKNPSLRNPPYVGIMHRLDRETSGVILFTKNRGINKAVSEMFQNHNFTKKYIAVVTPKGNSALKYKTGTKFCVEKYMGRITGKSKEGKWGTVGEKNGGQYSRTDFNVLEQKKIEGKNCLVVECLLYTGRTHQIRVHLSESGLPLLGDELYGGEKACRIYLHSCELACDSDELKFDVKSQFDVLKN